MRRSTFVQSHKSVRTIRSSVEMDATKLTLAEGVQVIWGEALDWYSPRPKTHRRGNEEVRGVTVALGVGPRTAQKSPPHHTCIAKGLALELPKKVTGGGKADAGLAEAGC